jgi:hypothetical protein
MFLYDVLVIEAHGEFQEQKGVVVEAHSIHVEVTVASVMAREARPYLYGP